uniref:Uncharacterized protein n=1 Tax=Glossina brevipalpis TaxID=37001 RepID=A0A1A9X152_9MUSC
MISLKILSVSMEQFCESSKTGPEICNSWLLHAFKHCRKMIKNAQSGDTWEYSTPQEINAYNFLLPNDIINPQSLDPYDCLSLFRDFKNSFFKGKSPCILASSLNYIFKTIVYMLFGLMALIPFLLFTIPAHSQRNKPTKKVHHIADEPEKYIQFVDKQNLGIARENVQI